jgi:hypothetical protein
VKKLAALLIFMATIFTGTNAFALVDLEGRYWITTIDDEIKSGTTGTNINFIDDLGVDDKENFFDVRATLEFGSHKLRYGYMPLSWEGTKTITRDIVFAGQTFSASGTVNTELDVAYHRLGYEYDIIDALNNRLGVIFEVKYFDIDASLSSTGVNGTASVKAPVPTIGIAAQAGLPFLLSVGGEITGMSLGSSAWIVDAEAGVNFKPAPFVVVSGGYRLLKLHLDYDDDLADISVQGPFVMLRADF